MKRLLLTAALALSMFAAEGGVLVTPHGKTYHKHNKCLALSRAKEVYTVTVELAQAHKLKPCGICYRPAKKKSNDNDWMKGTPK